MDKQVTTVPVVLCDGRADPQQQQGELIKLSELLFGCGICSAF